MSITNANTLAARLRGKVDAVKTHIDAEGRAAEAMIDGAISELNAATAASRAAAARIAASIKNEASDLMAELKRMDNGGPVIVDEIEQTQTTPIPPHAGLQPGENEGTPVADAAIPAEHQGKPA